MRKTVRSTSRSGSGIWSWVSVPVTLIVSRICSSARTHPSQIARCASIRAPPLAASTAGRVNTPRVWTIGYEKLLPGSLVAELEHAGVRRVLDSTPLYDAVATMDTVTLVRSAIRGLLRVADGGWSARCGRC